MRAAGRAIVVGLMLASAWLGAAAEVPKKVLRYAFEIAESTLDPAKASDLYSRTLTPHIFEGLYQYDHLARPIRTKPLTADGMPQVSSDFRTWTVKIKPGIYFADDPAFKGKKRELIAQDYVYSFKRFADPAVKAPAWTSLESEYILGLNEAHDAALKNKTPFDYDREIEGLRAIDRYTIQFKLRESRPRFDSNLAGSDLYGAVAREVVEFYGEQIDAHPVGTGPFKLVQWRRSSFIAFERNPDYRERYYDAEPTADDAEGQAIAARLKGKRLPMVDRVEISIVTEDQPRWLSFVTGEADLAYRVGYQFVSQAMPNGKVAPNLAKQHIRGYQIAESASNFMFFNMEDATVGGYTPDKVALRRAIGLGTDTRGLIAYAYSGLGGIAQTPLLPNTSAYDPALKTENGIYDPGRANALLDLYGYKDRNGDGWREMPDGSPLVIKVNTQSDLRSRRIAEVMTKNNKALGIRMESVIAQWPENLKAARTGKLQMWSLGLSAAGFDASPALARYDSRNIGGQNLARFKLPGFDELYDRIQLLPDGPERQGLFREAERIALAYMPYKYTLTRFSIDMVRPQLVGYRHPLFWNEWWQYVDIDESLRVRR